VRSVSYRGGAWEAALEAGLPEPLPMVSRVRPVPGETVPLAVTGGWVLPG
jgi:hypothetical protein